MDSTCAAVKPTFSARMVCAYTPYVALVTERTPRTADSASFEARRPATASWRFTHGWAIVGVYLIFLLITAFLAEKCGEYPYSNMLNGPASEPSGFCVMMVLP